MLDIKELIKSTFDKVKTTLNTEIASGSPAVMGVIAEYAVDAETRFAHLAQGALSGELSYKFVVERLAEEPKNLKNYLLSIAEIIGADLDQLAAKTVLILEEALKEGINQLQAAQAK